MSMENKNGMLYPLMILAAISVIIFSVVGIATMTGQVPSAFSSSASSQRSGDAPRLDHPVAGRDQQTVLPAAQKQRVGGTVLGAAAATISTKRPAMLSCTSTREGALQLSPWLKNMLPAAACAARSMSPKSGNTTKALLPPSSL